VETEMTVQDIEAQFDDEWVLIADPETDNDLRVLRGKVICHSKDRDEVYRRMLSLRLPDYAVLFTGEMPENTAVVL
jgi:hypothetical protein